jgi:hypothetical protein
VSVKRHRMTEFQAWLAALAFMAGLMVLLYNYPALLIGSALVYGGIEAFKQCDPPEEKNITQPDTTPNEGER